MLDPVILHQCSWIIACLWGFRWFAQLYMLWKKTRQCISGDCYTAMSEKSFIKAAHFDSFWLSEVFWFEALITPAYSRPWVNYLRSFRHVLLIVKMYIFLPNRSKIKYYFQTVTKSFKIKQLVPETSSELHTK